MNEFISNFHFIRPFALLLLPLAVGIWWLWQRLSDPLQGWRDQLDPELMHALLVGQKVSFRGPALAILLGWSIAILAIAGPTWQLEPSPFADDATPLMILLKADISMDVPDPAPSRLERAHLKVADLAEARKGQPLGLIAYAGSAHLVLPPTRDTATVAQMAAEISPDIMPRAGDQLDLALAEAQRILGAANQGGSILVITDAVDTDLPSLKRQIADVAFPVQFLAINAPDSSESASIQAAARTLKASITQLDVEGKDIAAIIRRAANAPVAQSGEGQEHWKDMGYWLVPFVGVCVLALFRREDNKEAAL